MKNKNVKQMTTIEIRQELAGIRSQLGQRGTKNVRSKLARRKDLLCELEARDEYEEEDERIM